MTRLIKKVHIYLGLLNFSIVLVFGIAGVRATVIGPPASWPKREPAVRFEDFAVAAGMVDDKAIAEQIRKHLNIPATISDIRRDAARNLSLTFITPSGAQLVTVMEKEHRLRIATTGRDIWDFFNMLHRTASRTAADWRVKLWEYYNEFALWSLSAMPLTGLYLWLASRPRHRPAQISFAVGGGAFILLYLLTR